MQIQFDPAKDMANQAKHGESLSLAGELDWEAALISLRRANRREVKHYVQTT